MSSTRDLAAVPVSVPVLRSLKGARRIAALTAYDAPTARLLDENGIDLILVGDSVEMVVYGAPSTLTATMDRMVAHARAVSGAVKRALVVGDMPYLTYHTTPEDAVRNAARFLVEGGCKAVKLEGGAPRIPAIRALLHAEIPVVGHLGLTPQSVQVFGGFKVQGTDAERAEAILEDAKRLEDTGVSALVLECVPADLAARVTEALSIPTIGIGAGAGCDGQILVLQDMLGLSSPGGRLPRFVRRYADLGAVIAQAVSAYADDVREGRFPSEQESFGAAPAAPVKLYGV
jgi:3-methyl-2-oxobutanoate hydroxymethyltransferase